MRKAGLGGILGGALVVAAAVACSDSNSPTTTGLAGNYVLDTLQVGADPAIYPPVATGTLTFTTASFVVGFVLHPPAVATDSTIALAGAYTLVKTDSIYLDVGPGLLTIPGTKSLNGNRLTLDVLVPGILLGSASPVPIHFSCHK